MQAVIRNSENIMQTAFFHLFDRPLRLIRIIKEHNNKRATVTVFIMHGSESKTIHIFQHLFDTLF